MPAGLVFPGVCRYVVHGTYAGRPIANILDMHIDSVDLTKRGDAIVDQAHIITSAWADHVMPSLSSQYQATETSWVDMNSSDGSTGASITGSGSSFPQNGGSGNACFPGSVALRVNKKLTAKRGARQGRFFLVGGLEQWTQTATPNTIDTSVVNTFNTALADFLSAINQSAGFAEPIYNSELVVVHTKNTGTAAAPVHVYVSRSHVDSLIMDNKIHSQRRRLG